LAFGATCQRRSIDPYAYLRDILTRLAMRQVILADLTVKRRSA
jgi:hypothetical protein